ncbi:AraC-like DNA-binding protein [Bacillus sp. es.036]|nr:AraC-like DNA-binding protein [Bacillus sp. es.036]
MASFKVVHIIYFYLIKGEYLEINSSIISELICNKISLFFRFVFNISNYDQKIIGDLSYAKYEVDDVNYSNTTQKTISYIEENLDDDIVIDELPSLIGYSKYHLLRVFKQETGKTIGEYIRHRRMAMASLMLLDSDESILSIGIIWGFQSQEAFTRAFKDIYNLPPSKYRKIMRTLLIKKEEDSVDDRNKVEKWTLSGSNPEIYEIKLDPSQFHTGKQSGLLYGKKETNQNHFATIMQGFQSNTYKGKRLKMSCFLKTEKVYKCGAWMRVDNKTGDVLQFDNMENRQIEGTTDWNYYSVILDVEEDSEAIHFGVLLHGSGKVWIDGFQFQEVSKNVQSTNILEVNPLPESPGNLDFSN